MTSPWSWREWPVENSRLTDFRGRAILPGEGIQMRRMILWLALLAISITSSAQTTAQNFRASKDSENALFLGLQRGARIAITGHTCFEPGVTQVLHESIRVLTKSIEDWGQWKVVPSELEADLALAIIECRYSMAYDAPPDLRPVQDTERTLILTPAHQDRGKPLLWAAIVRVHPWEHDALKDPLRPLREAVRNAENGIQNSLQANLQTRTGVIYDEQFRNEFGAKYAAAVAECRKNTAPKERVDFDVLVQLASGGLPSVVVVTPFTQVSSCLHPAIMKGEFRPAPQGQTIGPRSRSW